MKINFVEGTHTIGIGDQVYYDGKQAVIEDFDPNILWPEEAPMGIVIKFTNGRKKRLIGKQVRLMSWRRQTVDHECAVCGNEGGCPNGHGEGN